MTTELAKAMEHVHIGVRYMTRATRQYTMVAEELDSIIYSLNKAIDRIDELKEELKKKGEERIHNEAHQRMVE